MNDEGFYLTDEIHESSEWLVAERQQTDGATIADAAKKIRLEGQHKPREDERVGIIGSVHSVVKKTKLVEALAE
ncbi:hypothetical protein KIN20_009515 [Parelaphostrongylus tenuis]|uniref:Uncharacterized protein n=1 Tax=Parelaphostrongylus tenuis TaxID=148309 RepID=A0AAD5M6G3_PARTN|nr:hypothetical protein KIN20_009515 [Parelaphostrongylus tenuis]